MSSSHLRLSSVTRSDNPKYGNVKPYEITYVAIHSNDKTTLDEAVDVVLYRKGELLPEPPVTATITVTGKGEDLEAALTKLADSLRRMAAAVRDREKETSIEMYQ